MQTGFLFWKTKYFPFYAETNGYWYPLFTIFNENIFENEEVIYEIDNEEDKKRIKKRIDSFINNIENKRKIICKNSLINFQKR